MTDIPTPRPDPDHVIEGVCVCIHVGLKRVAVLTCGLSSHRVQAAADLERERSSK